MESQIFSNLLLPALLSLLGELYHWPIRPLPPDTWMKQEALKEIIPMLLKLDNFHNSFAFFGF